MTQQMEEETDMNNLVADFGVDALDARLETSCDSCCCLCGCGGDGENGGDGGNNGIVINPGGGDDE